MSLSKEDITRSEIALLKCISSKDYELWLNRFSSEYPLYETVKGKYEDVFYNEHKTLSGYKKYLKKFPKGKYAETARLQVMILEREKSEREKEQKERLENIGFIIILVIFFSVLLGPVIFGHWSIGETFACAISLTPLYYGIHSITRKRD